MRVSRPPGASAAPTPAGRAIRRCHARSPLAITRRLLTIFGEGRTPFNLLLRAVIDRVRPRPRRAVSKKRSSPADSPRPWTPSRHTRSRMISPSRDSASSTDSPPVPQPTARRVRYAAWMAYELFCADREVECLADRAEALDGDLRKERALRQADRSGRTKAEASLRPRPPRSPARVSPVPPRAPPLAPVAPRHPSRSPPARAEAGPRAPAPTRPEAHTRSPHPRRRRPHLRGRPPRTAGRGGV